MSIKNLFPKGNFRGFSRGRRFPRGRGTPLVGLDNQCSIPGQVTHQCQSIRNWVKGLQRTRGFCFIERFQVRFFNSLFRTNKISWMQELKIGQSESRYCSEKKIAKELSEDKIARPFTEPPFKNFRVSPIDLVEKKTKGEYRMIHHLSYPRGDSVNDFIDPELCTVQYTSFDQAIKMVQTLIIFAMTWYVCLNHDRGVLLWLKSIVQEW